MAESLLHFWPQVEQAIDRALAEDVAFGDVTTEALIPLSKRGEHNNG